jgi:solute carrier family 25 carnitine/acylcarnitine transporter 20/29
MASKDVEEQGALRTVKDLTSGAVGGVAQVLLGKLICCLEFLA